jgi:hypothetical protein
MTDLETLISAVLADPHADDRLHALADALTLAGRVPLAQSIRSHLRECRARHVSEPGRRREFVQGIRREVRS